MNPHAAAPVSPAALCRSLWRHHELILQMMRREVAGRYKGSVLGLAWSLANPVILLVVYTLVFSEVFQMRWGTGPAESRAQFAVLLFVGMTVHGLFAETLVRAPHLVLSNVSYVKRIVFPLEILPVVAMGTAAFHAAVSILVLGGALLIVNGALPWTAIFLPVVLLPLIVLTLGIAWTLASLGVFLRDVAQPIGLLMTVLLFASPVFYPVAALPAPLRPWLMLNPLTFIIEQARAVLVQGRLPDGAGLLLYSSIALACAWLGYAWFQKTRKGFANVL